MLVSSILLVHFFLFVHTYLYTFVSFAYIFCIIVSVMTVPAI